MFAVAEKRTVRLGNQWMTESFEQRIDSRRKTLLSDKFRSI